MNTDEQLDELLKEGLIAPPAGFANKVINQIEATAEYARHAEPLQTITHRRLRLVPSLALAASTVLGILQVLGFVFGLWIPAAAG